MRRLWTPGLPRLTPRRGAPGFVSPPSGRGVSAFAGLGEAAPAFSGDLCAALFGNVAPGAAPVALFTDYRCPNCRRIAADTLEMARDPSVSLRFHDWPVLGPASVLGARAALAARRQGRAAYLAMHERLMATSFLPNRAWIAQSAASMGLDAARLEADMAAPAVDAELARTAALARRMGLFGTPSLVFGNVVLDGAGLFGARDSLIARARETGCPA